MSFQWTALAWTNLGGKAARVLLCVVAGYAVICLVVFFFQKKLIYFPAASSDLRPAQFGFESSQATGVETKSADGVTLRGWRIGAARAASPLVDLFFCGNGGNRGYRAEKFRILSSLGVTVVCFDYRGYGDSAGSPDEEGFAHDARAAWEYVRASGVNPGAIIIHGESLGSAVATRLAAELCAEGKAPAGLLLEAPFTTLRDAAAVHYPFLPVGLLLTQRFASIERISMVTCPILILHGRQDQVVPFELGERLFSRAPETSAAGRPKTFVAFPVSGHNDLGFAERERYETALRNFFLGALPAQHVDR